MLAAHPEILVLDEPTANLDPAARRDLIEVISGLQLTTLVITHDLPLALELCPRSVVVAHGRVAADGPTPALFANPSLLAAHRLELPYRMVAPPPGLSHPDTCTAIHWRSIPRRKRRWGATGAQVASVGRDAATTKSHPSTRPAPPRPEPRPATPDADHRLGVLAGVAAYSLWGVFPWSSTSWRRWRRSRS